MQRQQQHQQQARNSKGETQGSQISLMRTRSGSTGTPTGRFLSYFLLSRQIWLIIIVQDEHGEGGDRALMPKKHTTPSQSWTT